MKRKELLENISQNMPKDLNELEIAAYITKEIALNRNFYAKYYWGDKQTRYKMYNLARQDDQIQLQDNPELICVTACRLYKYIAQKYGLDIHLKGERGLVTENDYSIFKNGEHVSPITKLKDGRSIKTDVEWNLENIKTGLKWKKFGTIEKDEQLLSYISDEELDIIMNKIGYKKEEEKYLNEYCKKLYFNQAKKLSIYERLKLIFDDLGIIKSTEKLTGSVEIYRFYRQLIKDFTKEEKQYNNNIFIFGVRKSQKDYEKCKDKDSGNSKYTICTFYQNEDKKHIWLYSKKARKNIEILPEELSYYLKDNQIGMIAGKSGKALQELYNYIEISNKVKQAENIDEMII